MLVAVNDWSVTHVTCHGHSLTLQFLLSTPTLCARTDVTSYLPRWGATERGKRIKKTEGWRREREREEEGGKQCEHEDQDKGETLRTCAVHSSPPFALSSADISHGDSVDNLSPCKMSIASGLPPLSLHPTGNFAVFKKNLLTVDRGGVRKRTIVGIFWLYLKERDVFKIVPLTFNFVVIFNLCNVGLQLVYFGNYVFPIA